MTERKEIKKEINDERRKKETAVVQPGTETSHIRETPRI
jgi:hypothetical protein